MKISDGRYTYSREDNIQKLVDKQRAENAVLQAQLNMVGDWARQQLKLHQPYINHMDVSCADPDKMKDALLKQIGKDIWCARCSNPWPCKHIANLRLLRDLSRRNDINTLPDLEVRLAAMPTQEPCKGQLPVGM